MQASKLFRERLRAAMTLRGMSQRELAKRAKTGHSGVNRILQGDQVPTLEVADKLAEAVDIPLWQLLATAR